MLLIGAASLIANANDADEHDHSTPGAAIAAPTMMGEYVENKGQWPDPVLFRADFGVTALFAEQGRLTFSKWADDVPEKVHELQHSGDPAGTVLSGHAWYMIFTGARADATIERTGISADHFNYFIGNDPSKWATEVRHYMEVRYRDLWPGVDLRLYDQQGAFKYDLELASGDRVDQVGFTYEGLDAIGVNEKGELVLRTSVGELYESTPVAWYADGAKEKVECSFILNGNSVGFKLAEGTDRSRPIVIDPLLIASTLSGTGNIGSTQNYGHTATYDEAGNIYTGAICFGQGYPTTPGAFDSTFGSTSGGFGVDIAVSKLDPTGSNLLFATYLGGDGGDYPHSMVVTLANELTLYGSSDSNNYPTTPNAFDTSHNGGADIVVTKLNSTGTALIGSTYMGTSAQDGRNSLTSNYGDSYRGEIISDGSGQILVASCSHGTGFPTSTDAVQPIHGGGQDGVAFCLSPNLSTLVWSTYIGTASDDMAFGIKLNSAGEAYVAGGTSSNAFPTTAGSVQPASAGGNEAFIVHLNDNASQILHSTYFGTTGSDIAFFIQLDQNEDVYIYGQSPDGLVPIAPAGIYGVAGGGSFVAEFTADLSSSIFTTSLGPTSGGWSNGMVPVAFLVDICYNIYVSGYSPDTGWDISSDPLYSTGGFYLAVYEEDMSSLLYGTYYEGASHVDGGTSRFDSNGIVYQAVCTSGGFPTTPNAYSNVQPFGWDVGVFKIDMQQAGVQVYIQTESTQGCAPATFTFNGSGNAPQYVWDMGDGTTGLTGDTIVYTYEEVGTYVITLVGLDPATCNFSDTTMITVTVGDGQAPQASFQAEPYSSCDGFSAQFENTSTPASDIIWDFGDGETGTDNDPLHVYDAPGTYDVWLTISDDICGGTDSVLAQVVIPLPTMDYDLNSPLYLCSGSTVMLNAGGGYDSYLWDDGSNAQMISVNEPGMYTVQVTDGMCEGQDSIEVVPAPEVAKMDDVVSCPGLVSELQVPFPVNSVTWNTGSDSTSITVDESGPYWFTAIDAYGCTRIDTAEVQVIPVGEASATIPNVFTPNGDGWNDRFQVSGIGVTDFYMEVYNRWGQMMFTSSDPGNGWNGGKDNTANDTPDGTYYYIVSYKDLCSDEPKATHHGHVTLLR